MAYVDAQTKHTAELAALKQAHAEELKKAKAEPTYDCRQLLNDLTRGHGIVQITPISPMDIYIKRN